MIAVQAEPQSQFTQRRADYVHLLAQLASELPRRVLCCAAELMSYFQHWNQWKRLRYREDWFYQPLRKIRHDLTDAYTVHVIQKAITLLVELKLLSVKKNDRTLNNRNGQDRTHYYLIHCDRIKTALVNLLSQPKKSKTRKDTQLASGKTPSAESGTRSVETRTPRFTVETHTKILSINSSTNSYSLLEREEESNFVQEEIEDPWTVEADEEEDEVEQKLVVSCKDLPEISQEQKESNEDHSSAAPEPKSSEVVQNNLKSLPKLKSDRPSGFRSDAERDGFYQALLELGKTQGKKSPAAWSTKIVKSVDAGEPCQYLTEYREGQQVGSCEKQEWEIAPGQVFPRFISYLTTKLKKAEMTDEQAIVTAHQQLKDVNLARSLWESCKRYIAKCQQDWEQQRQLGVQNAYVPPELLPEREVSFEQAGDAIASLQTGCPQLEPVEHAELPSATADALEPAKELPTEQEPESVSLAVLQQKLDSPVQAPLARMRAKKMGYRIEEGLVLPGGEEIPSVEYLASLLTNPITARKVQRLIAAHPEWGFWIDAAGEIQDF